MTVTQIDNLKDRWDATSDPARIAELQVLALIAIAERLDILITRLDGMTADVDSEGGDPRGALRVFSYGADQ